MFAKIMQASGKKACFQFPERSLSYAKIMQASGKKACFQFPERSLSYAKVVNISQFGRCVGLINKNIGCRAALFSQGFAPRWI